MQINFKTTNLNLTPELKKFITRRLQVIKKLLKEDRKNEKYKKEKIQVLIELAERPGYRKKEQKYYAEINIYLPGKTLRAEAENWDIRLAFNEAKEESERQIRKYKTELRHKSFARQRKLKSTIKSI